MTRNLTATLEPSPAAEISAPATNVIFMVPDGFGNVSAEAYRFFKGGSPAWEDGIQASVRTASANRSVTDSAAAATAYATGVKTDNGKIAVDAEGNALVSILSLAVDAGKSAGIVTTDLVTGATPAAFAANNKDRDAQQAIAQDYIDRSELTVILGGGRASFLADPDDDGLPTLLEARLAGFDYVNTSDEMLASDSARLLGLFGLGPLGLPTGNPAREPSLAEMTGAALDRLSLDPDGFFLVVEAVGTDFWAHQNDSAAVMRSAEEYEDALELALSFAESTQNTLVVSVADHDTAGMRLTPNGTGTPAIFDSYEASYAEMFFEIIEDVADLGFFPGKRAVINSVRESVLDLTDGSVRLTRSEILSLLDASSFDEALFDFSGIMNSRGGVEYTTTSHTDADVFLFAYGPGSEEIEGTVENNEVGTWLADAMGLSFPPEQDYRPVELDPERFATDFLL